MSNPVQQIETQLEELLEQGKSIDEIIKDFSEKKYYFSIVELIFLKRGLLNKADLYQKFKANDFYNTQINQENPFTHAFIESFNKKK